MIDIFDQLIAGKNLSDEQFRRLTYTMFMADNCLNHKGCDHLDDHNQLTIEGNICTRCGKMFTYEDLQFIDKVHKACEEFNIEEAKSIINNK